MSNITDHRSLIDALGGNKAVAGKLTDCTPGRVGQWKIGNRIPAEYWLEIIALAAEVGVEGIHMTWLATNLPPRGAKAASEAAA